MKKPSLLLLAAGMGSRYGGLKQLDSIGPNGETIIDYSIYDAIQAGFDKVVFVIRESFAKDFEQKVSNKFNDKIKVEFAFQSFDAKVDGLPVKPIREKPWGTGHAVLVARDSIDAPFAVANADDFYGASSFKAMADFLMNRVRPNHYSMIGFELGKTLSPNGTVSRGVCETNAEDLLRSVLERKSISKDEAGLFDLEDGIRVDLKENLPVSMNLWGFHPNFFDTLSDHFNKFVKENYLDPRSEFYIPLVVNELLLKSVATVEVVPSAAQWYGVTYQEDKATVQAALKALNEDGSYPSPLW